MTSSEALEQISLKPDASHSGTAVGAAINMRMLKAQRAFKAAFTARDQEAAMKQLEQRQVAAHIIRAEIKGNVVRIPGPVPTVERTPTAPKPKPVDRKAGIPTEPLAFAAPAGRYGANDKER